MNKEKESKMTRQLRLYSYLLNTKIHGPEDIMNDFHISRRMMQRDLKDLRDSGVLNLKYDKKADNYVKCGDATFDPLASGRRKQHLLRLFRLATLITGLTRTNMEELREYKSALEDYEFYLDLSKEDPEENPPESLDPPPDMPIFADIKGEYYSLFPDSNERTRQRDFKELNEAGFPIYYDRQYKAFIYEDGSEL